jgi:hypothetical protein
MPVFASHFFGRLSSFNESRRVAFRQKTYRSIGELQTDLDLWISEYNDALPFRNALLNAVAMTREEITAA